MIANTVCGHERAASEKQAPASASVSHSSKRGRAEGEPGDSTGEESDGEIEIRSIQPTDATVSASATIAPPPPPPAVTLSSSVAPVRQVSSASPKIAAAAASSPPTAAAAAAAAAVVPPNRVASASGVVPRPSAAARAAEKAAAAAARADAKAARAALKLQIAADKALEKVLAKAGRGGFAEQELIVACHEEFKQEKVSEASMQGQRSTDDSRTADSHSPSFVLVGSTRVCLLDSLLQNSASAFRHCRLLLPPLLPPPPPQPPPPRLSRSPHAVPLLARCSLSFPEACCGSVNRLQRPCAKYKPERKHD